MAQDIEIVELLREMKRADSVNSQSFERLLNSMNSKLDVMEKNPASVDFIKAYLGDLTKNIDDKYSTTISRFKDIESALNTLYKKEDENVKIENIRELFDIFSQNMNNVYSEARQQKALLSSIENKLSGIGSDKSDKEDILRTITLLRNDLENVNLSYKNTIDTFSSDLKNILSNIIKTEQAASSSREQVEVMCKAVSDIISYLNAISKRDETLEKLLSGVATGESLKITQGVVDAIIEKSKAIEKRVNLLSDKADIESLQAAAGIMVKKLDETATKDLFEKIAEKTDEITAQTADVKQALAEITKNVETLPDTDKFESSLLKLYNTVEQLRTELSDANVKENIHDIENKISNLITELTTVKNIAGDINEALTSKVIQAVKEVSFENESYDIKNHVSKMLSQLPQKEDIDRILESADKNGKALESLSLKADKIADRLDSLPTHDDMAALNDNQLGLVENLQGVANKEDIEKLSEKSDEIEKMIDNLNFDNEFENLYDKSASIEDWLVKSNIKETSEDILSQITDKAEQKDLLQILKATEKIVSGLEELSANVDVKKVNRTVAEVYSMIEDLKNDFMNTTEMHHDSVVVQLSELQKSITKIATVEDFANFVEGLKSFVESTVENNTDIVSNLAEIKNYEETIIDKLNNINTSAIEELISANSNNTQEKITSLSEYIENFANSSKDEIHSALAEITEILQNKKSNFDEIEKKNADTITSIETYIKEIKNILDTSDKKSNEDLMERFNALEDLIVEYKTTHRDMLCDVLVKLDEYKTLTENGSGYSKHDFENSLSELSEIKNQIKSLGESFSALNYEKTSQQGNISGFLADRLNEIGSDIETLSANIDNQLEQGFAYNSELIEEKTSALSELVKKLRHSQTENIDLYERLTVTDNKLLDFKQELELINTDIVSNLNSKTEDLIAEIAPVKEMLQNLAAGLNSETAEKVKDNLGSIHDSVQGDLAECTKYAKSTYDKLENLYSGISDSLSASENNLRDFILGDIDSVIIKIDNLRGDLEESLNRIAPPDAKSMGEFREFVNQINEFKKEQKNIIVDAAEDIKTTLSEKITAQHEELKSILSVSINNEEIINAIDNLKRCFKAKIKDLKLSQDVLPSEDVSNDGFDNNEYEQVFEQANNNARIIGEIKADFNKFTQLVEDLSDKNPEIKEVLELIREKMESVSVIKSPEIMPEIVEDTEFENTEAENEQSAGEPEIEFDETSADETEGDENDILVGANNFDIVKALDLLKQDIQNLHKDVEKVIPKEEQKKTSETLKSIPALDNSSLLITLNNKVELLSKALNKDWLEEIKNYIAGSDIQALLEEISGKIDILTLSDNNEWVGEIKQSIENLNNADISTVSDSNKQIQTTLNLINEKIDILAASDDYDVMADIKDALERIEHSQTPASVSDKLLNLINEKVDILAASDSYGSIEEIKDTLSSIESIKETLERIEHSQQSAPVSDKLLGLINEKMDVLAASDSYDSIEEIKDTLSSIESIKETLERIEQSQQSAPVSDKLLNLINEKVDILAASDNYDSIEEIRDVLAAIDDKIESSNIGSSKFDSADLDDIKYTLQNVDEKVDGVKHLSEADAKITSILETLNHKIDILAQGDISNADSKQDLEDVKHLILAQMDYLEKLEKNNKTDAVKKCLQELTLEVNSFKTNGNANQIQKTLKEMKESIMAAVVAVFEQVSFVEESEDIKDFVETKTDEINQNLTNVTKQLKQITSSDEVPDYTYSMQDIESDLAKLRLALNNAQESEQEVQAKRLSFILDNISQIGTAVGELQESITNEEALGLKVKFDRINTDIKSLNAITNQLLKKSGESYNALNSGIEGFGKILTEQLGSKVDTVTALLEKSNASDKVMRQALIYMGEWIDAASESMNKISTNSSEITDVKSALEGLKSSIPEQTDILNSIEEKFDEQQERLSYFEKQISKLGNLENRFEEQQERIDRLEMSLDKILSAVEDIDDSRVTKKIDKIDKQIAKLSVNIEKLASYVD